MYVISLIRPFRENLKFYVEQRMPLEIEKCYAGLNIVLRQAFEIASLENAKTSDKICSTSAYITYIRQNIRSPFGPANNKRSC